MLLVLQCVERLRNFDISGLHHQQEFCRSANGNTRRIKFKSVVAHSKAHPPGVGGTLEISGWGYAAGSYIVVHLNFATLY